MVIFSARSAGAGSATLPVSSVYNTAGVGARIRELHVWNTTATAVTLAVARLSTAGTQGSSITARTTNSSSETPTITGWNTHTGGPTLTFIGFQFTLAGTIGAGVILPFSDPLTAPLGTGNGIGLYVPTGTGQVVDFTWVCDT
jgi:hypothetical protein